MSTPVQLGLLVLGALLLVVALMRAIAIRPLIVGRSAKSAYGWMILLTTGFLVGYAGAIALLASGRETVLVALSTIIFAAGAVFVVVTVGLTHRIALSLRELSDKLEARVYERTRELETSNRDLQLHMERLREAQEQLRKAERAGMAVDLAANAARELGKPIVALRQDLQLVRARASEVEALSEAAAFAADSLRKAGAGGLRAAERLRLAAAGGTLASGLRHAAEQALEKSERLHDYLRHLRTLTEIEPAKAAKP